MVSPTSQRGKSDVILHGALASILAYANDTAQSGVVSSGAGRGCYQTNWIKQHKPWERAFYEAIRERHSVRAASRLSLKVLRVDSDLCELK